VTELPLEQAVDLVKDAFVSAGERDIYTVSRKVMCELNCMRLCALHPPSSKAPALCRLNVVAFFCCSKGDRGSYHMAAHM
jgi:hypothetical protein